MSEKTPISMRQADRLIGVFVLALFVLAGMIAADLKKLIDGLFPTAPAVERMPPPVETQDAAMRAMAERVREIDASPGVDSRMTDQEISITLSEMVLYESGEAHLSEAGKEPLDKVIRMIRDLPGDVRIEGHTDDVPITHATEFSSNYELSLARAVNVATYFVETGGIASDRITAVGFGATRPKVPNDTEADRAMNRRVEIIMQTRKRPPGAAPEDVPADAMNTVLEMETEEEPISDE